MQATNREIWKSINGYANYEVSCFGRVRNATTERILKPGLSSNGYLTVRISKNSKAKTHNIHQLVAREFLRNPFDLKCIDHIDGNKTNNNLDNLRFCSLTQNQGNRKKQENTSSIYKGVCWAKTRNKWRVQIKINDVVKHLGYFDNEKEAARTYNRAAEEHFKEFAKLNQIEND